jgi:hypothetical protein
MNLFVMLGLLLWICTIAALLLCLLVLVIIACVKKSRKLALWSIAGTVGAMLVATGVFFGLAYLCFRPYDPTSDADLNQAYRADFGTLPPAGVTVLNARQIVVGDSGGQWLLLKVTPEEIDKHIAMGFMKAETIPSNFRGAAGANAPKWWQPPAARLELYENKNWSKAGGWSSSEATMGIDRSSNVIWFAVSKWD